MKKILLGLLVLFAFTSCQKILVRTLLIKTPRVETTASIKAFQERHNFSTNNTLIIDADSTDIQSKLFRGLTTGYMFFDKNGNLMKYKGTETCSGTQLGDFLDNDSLHYELAANDSLTFQKILAETYDLNGNSVSMTELEPADYYLVAYWAKFLGKKRGYKDKVGWAEAEILKNNNSSKDKIAFIKINTDMQEKWGMKKGKKAKMKLKLNKKEGLSIAVTKIPFND